MSNQGSLGEAVLDLTADKEPLMKDIENAKPGVLAAMTALGTLAGNILTKALEVAFKVAVAIPKAIWDAGNTLDAAYDKIQTQTGATGEQLQVLQDDFEAVFQYVPASADEAATAVSGLNQRLGATGPVLQDMAANLLEVTRITGGDLNTNIELYTRFMGDAGIATEDGSVALDTLFAISQKTGTGIDRLMQLSVQFGAPMRQFGFTWVESASLLGKWEKEGVNTELVMGSLRIAAGKFANENIPLREGLQDTFEKIKNAKDESSALAIAMDVFGARAGPDMAAAIRENRFELGDFIASISEADGLIMETAQSTMDWGERWTQFKNRLTVALGPAGMGLMDAVGKGLDTIAALASRQDVQTGLMAIVNFIVLLAQNAATYLPIAIDKLFQFVDFLRNNQGVVIAILAALGVAIGAFVYTTLIPAAIAAVTAFAPILLIIALVAAAAYLLYQAWTQNWGGIQEKVATFWAWLQPMLQTLWNWLAVNVPLALQTMSGYWTNTLLPAIMAVWGWLNGTLFPYFQALANFWSSVFNVALTAMAGIWQNVLAPALQQVWDWLSGKLMPIFNQLLPIVQEIAGWIGEQLVSAFESLTAKLQAVTTWLNNVAGKLNSMHLPSWMTPGSPTPWEIGLWGVNDALQAVGNMSLPNLSASMTAMPAPAIADGGVALNSAGGATPVQFVYQPFIGVNDEYEAKTKLRSIVNDLNREASRK